MRPADRDSQLRPAPRGAEDIQWVDDEFAVPSEELLLWLDGELSESERSRLRASPNHRRAARGVLWRAAPGRMAWRVIGEHRGLALLCVSAALICALALERMTSSTAAQALASAQFAHADALLEPRAEARGWTHGGSMLRSSPALADERRPRTPSDLVLELRPRFEWAEAAARELRVFDFEGRELWSWRGSAQQVDYAAEAPLVEGARYRATVTLEGEKRQPAGLVFSVADVERRQSIEAALARAREQAEGDQRSLHFARAAVFARAGLQGEAGREIELLSRALDANGRARLAEYLIEHSAPQLAERAANPGAANSRAADSR